MRLIYTGGSQERLHSCYPLCWSALVWKLYTVNSFRTVRTQRKLPRLNIVPKKMLFNLSYVSFLELQVDISLLASLKKNLHLLV